ncbi:Bcr/CflA family efflux MFS transporter [bacterium]|nr:Bcr/CflA family efflux MFS transporter [bacterium]NBX71759.1 Bcr/CflA family efflux MFS transporter [bacterium]
MIVLSEKLIVQLQNKKTNILFVVGPMVVLGALAMDIYIPFVPMLKAEFQTTSFNIQATLNIFMLFMAFGQLIIGPMSDYYGRKKMLLVSIFTYLLGSLACFFTQDIYLFIAARGLQAMGSCGGQVIAYAVVKDYAEGSQAQRLFSYLMGIVGMAPIIAPPLGTTLAHYFGSWRVIFIFLSLYALVAMVYISIFFKEKKTVTQQQELPSLAEIRYILLDPTFKQWALIPALSLTGLFLFFAMSPHYIQHYMGYSRWAYSLIFSFNAILYSIGSFSAPRIIQRYSATKVIQLGLLIIMTATCIMIAQSYLASTSLPLFLTCIYSCCIAYALMQGAAMGLALESFKHNLGLASAILGSVQFLTATLIGTLFVHPPIERSAIFALPMLLLAILSYRAAFANPFSKKSYRDAAALTTFS